MTQLIADVLKRDEGERLRQRNLEKRIRLGMMYYPDTPFALPGTHDGHNPFTVPFTAWMNIPPDLNVAEFAMPTAWARAERAAPTARYRVR